MDDRTRRRRIAILLATHLVIGTAMAIVAALWKPYQWPVVIEMGYLTFFMGELFLHGMWIGLANLPWWVRIVGMVLGIAYLCGASWAASDPLDANWLRELMSEMVP